MESKLTNDENQIQPSSPRRVWWVVLALAISGVGVAAKLAHIHFKVHTDAAFQSFCAYGTKVNCDSVAQSGYSVMLGVPVAVWGLGGYLAACVLAIAGLRRPHCKMPLVFMGLWATVSIVASGYLLFISATRLHAFCPLCLMTYALNIGLGFCAWLVLARAQMASLKSVSLVLMSNWKGIGHIGLCGALAALLASTFFPSYWVHSFVQGPGGLPIGIDDKGHPWIGAIRPRVVIHEYSDYHCPFCQRGHADVRSLVSKYPESIRLVHHNYPLDARCNKALTTSMHPRASEYAAMATCAGRQGKFWEANDYLFTHAHDRSPVIVDALCAATGISASPLSACLRGEAQGPIASDIDAGDRLGLEGTPTFVIDGQLFVGTVPAERLLPMLGIATPTTSLEPQPDAH